MKAWLQRGPLSSPLQNSHSSWSTKARLNGRPASPQLLPAPSKYHIDIQTPKHTHRHTGNILSGVQLEQTQRIGMTATITHREVALLVWLHHPEIWSPPPAPCDQEHWAHKPGHVLLCPVCQNNSAVSNTVCLWFHFSLPRYCTTEVHIPFVDVNKSAVC